MQNAEVKTCASCQAEFRIEPEDFAFYEKMEVPAPTWCPDCRAQRRLAWRNEWRLFRKLDAREGTAIFSSFSPGSPVNIYDNTYWYSDAWDPMDYGRDYDFSKPFFTQMEELLQAVPLQARSVHDNENSDYCMNAKNLKNCYLVRVAQNTQDSAYLVNDHSSRDSFDCHVTNNCERCYGSLNLNTCYQTFFSVNCDNCRDVILSKDCVGSSNLVGCVNLRNKQYCIFNEQLSKEEYFEQLAALKLDSHEHLEALTKRAHAFWLEYPHRFMQGSSNEDVSGEYMYESKNAHSCYRVRGVENSKYCHSMLSGPVNDCYDYTGFGIEGAERIYESVATGVGVNNIRFCWYARFQVTNLQYSMYCEHASDLFGCVGLSKKQYCILNKQYTKDEYEALVPRIIQHMNEMPYIDTKGREYRYGEFFPVECSPIEYNVSMAQEYYPLTKEEVVDQGYWWWVDAQPSTIETAWTSEQLADSIREVDESIVGQVIACAHGGTCNEQCKSVFTLIPQELAFLLEQGLPLPRLCPNCRHYSRIQQRNPMQLHQRRCDCAGSHSEPRGEHRYANTAAHGHHSQTEACPNEFVTSYDPAWPEIVYCEACYQQEVA